jgi:hypothetical protein
LGGGFGQGNLLSTKYEIRSTEIKANVEHRTPNSECRSGEN